LMRRGCGRLCGVCGPAGEHVAEGGGEHVGRDAVGVVGRGGEGDGEVAGRHVEHALGVLVGRRRHRRLHPRLVGGV
jgi:hypothetical protein